VSKEKPHLQLELAGLLSYNLENRASDTLSQYIHTYIPLTLDPRSGSRGVSDIPLRRPRFTKMTNTADVIGGKPIAVESIITPIELAFPLTL
jgi:hypothetical protein